MKLSRIILVILAISIMMALSSCSSGSGDSTDDSKKEESSSKSKEEEKEKVFPKERPSAARGKAIYDEQCLKCHGETGSGEGEKSKNFTDEVKDFNDQAFMRKEVPSKFFEKIKDGDKPMPAFKDDLTEQEMWDVVFYVWTFQSSEELKAQGKAVYDEKCAKCHGENGDGKGPDAGDLEKEPTNFTDFKKMVGEKSNGFFKDITDGEKDEGMPSFKKKLSPGERWNVIDYIWSFSYEQ